MVNKPSKHIGPSARKPAEPMDVAPDFSLDARKQVLPPEVEANREAILASPTYVLAEKDTEWLRDSSMRPVRMQLELQKTELLLVRAGIKSTVVVFGGTQIVPREEAESKLAAAKAELAAAPDSQTAKRAVVRAEARLKKSRFYNECREFAKIVSGRCQLDGKCEFVVTTGGGPGVMEAGNRGAFEIGAKTIGLNIELPHEQEPNPYITPELCFQFHYFAMRKFHFILRAAALVVFPGGFGTLDELFNTLCLRQTGRMQAIPIILYGKEYWDSVINFQALADEGVIADEHLDLISYAETPQEAWDLIAKFHNVV
ncbi:LOG family protein [Botrimarina mediterranea]|uniref:AMP nucleosidase n=1 Tax=Botrimarina mediterranea TaxID=2528022 RepID=A0A518K359_9BACT|nr:LOG family protein [Botrimarina mediterranea]QDV72217.1 putative lysine decarboxylase [Botrimarina mediterranea]QDV76761.1 putative lysine decarboxylase [Planctomycetes bacterium K2D]